MPGLTEDIDDVHHLAGRRREPRGKRPGAIRAAGGVKR